MRTSVPPIYRVIGNNILRHRRGQRMTQEELGLRCDMEGSTICDYEKAARTYKVDTLERVARGLGVPLAELLKEEHDAR